VHLLQYLTYKVSFTVGMYVCTERNIDQERELDFAPTSWEAFNFPGSQFPHLQSKESGTLSVEFPYISKTYKPIK